MIYTKGLTSICLSNTMFGVCSQQVKQISPPSQLGYYEKFIVHTKHIIQPNDIVMSPQLSQHIHLLL